MYCVNNVNTIKISAPFEGKIELNSLRILLNSRITHEKGSFCRAALSHDGKMAAITIEGTAFIVYSIPRLQKMLTIDTKSASEVTFFESSRNIDCCYYVAVGHDMKAIELYELKIFDSFPSQAKYERLVSISVPSYVFGMCPVSNGIVYCFQKGNKRCLRRLNIDGTRTNGPKLGNYSGCCFLPNTQEVVVGDGNRKQVYFFDTTQGRLEYRRTVGEFAHNAEYPKFSPDGELFVGCWDHRIFRVLSSGKVECGIECNFTKFRPIGDGFIAYPKENWDNTLLVLCDWRTGEKVREISVPGIGYISCAEYSKQGYLVVFGSKGISICSGLPRCLGEISIQVPQGMSLKGTESSHSGMLSTKEDSDAQFFLVDKCKHCIVVDLNSKTVYFDGVEHSRYPVVMMTNQKAVFLVVSDESFAILSFPYRSIETKKVTIASKELVTRIQSSQIPSFAFIDFNLIMIFIDSGIWIQSDRKVFAFYSKKDTFSSLEEYLKTNKFVVTFNKSKGTIFLTSKESSFVYDLHTGEVIENAFDPIYIDPSIIPAEMELKCSTSQHTGILETSEGNRAFYFLSQCFNFCVVYDVKAKKVYINGKEHAGTYELVVGTSNFDDFLIVGEPENDNELILYRVKRKKNSFVGREKAIILSKEELETFQESVIPLIVADTAIFTDSCLWVHQQKGKLEPYIPLSLLKHQQNEFDVHVRKKGWRLSRLLKNHW